MRRFLFSSFVILLPALAVAAFADDQAGDSGAKKDASSKATKKITKEKVRTDLVRGKLIHIEPTQRYVTVQVTRKIPQENSGAAQNIANLERQLVGNRDINSIRNIRIEIMKNQQNLVTYKDDVQKIEFSLDDDLKVRTLLLPLEYDDKGKPRKLSAKELKALKGPDSKLPGYESEFDSLKPQQTVDVYLAKTKDAQRAKPKDKDKDAPEGKERQRAITIVIVSEPAK